MSTSSSEDSTSERKKDEETGPLSLRQIDKIYENFRRDLEKTFRPWSMSTLNWELPSFFAEGRESRLALCDLADRGDRYELQVEVPGIEKEKVDVKATRHYIEISGKHSEKTEEKSKNYLYNERSYRSFFRRVPVPEEIVPSKVSAKMNNGILSVELPKKTPTKVEDESANVKVQ